MKPEISDTIPADAAQIAFLLRDAFQGEEEVDLMARLRKSKYELVELCARQNGDIIGHICLTEMISPRKWGALAPLSVAPNHQKKGTGSALIFEAINRAKLRGWKALVVLGDPNYYSRFGFSVERAQGYTSPYPILYTGILLLGKYYPPVQGIFTYPAEFEGV